MQFHETVYGKRFFDAQLPRLIKELGRIADALEKEHEPEKTQSEEIVKITCRCKDCQYWVDGCVGCTDRIKLCEIGHYMVLDSGYCVYAVKRKIENLGDKDVLQKEK